MAFLLDRQMPLTSLEPSRRRLVLSVIEEFHGPIVAVRTSKRPLQGRVVEAFKIGRHFVFLVDAVCYGFDIFFVSCRRVFLVYSTVLYMACRVPKCAGGVIRNSTTVSISCKCHLLPYLHVRWIVRM